MDMVGNVAPQILATGGSEEKGELARLTSFVGAMAVGDLVKTTLGPKGMDKILRPTGAGPVPTTITVTNDGATILKSMFVDNAAAKILIEISKTQDEEIGDGTTSVAVLAGELLREGEKLMNQKIHPQVVAAGWKLARDCARAKLVSIARDNSKDQEKFKADLMNIAMTTLSSKLLTGDKSLFAGLAVDAVMRLQGSGNLDYIQVIKKSGGSLRDSFLSNGILLEKTFSIGCPKRIENAKIMIANTPMDYDKIKIYGTKAKVDSMEKVAQIEEAEKQKMARKVEKIALYEPTVFINRQLIYNYPEQLLVDKKMMVIEHADFEGIERLSAATGGEICSTFDNPERKNEILGKCDLIEEVMIGEEKLIKFSGCKQNESCTIVIRGASQHVIDEAERSLHDALCVLTTTVKNHKVVYGGGNAEIQMAAAVDELAKTVPGKQAFAIEAYARALRQIPTIIADNGGYDSAELVQNLRVEIGNGQTSCGLNMNEGIIGCMEEMGVTECLRSKEQSLIAASEAAELIMRVDDIIKCAPRERKRM